MQASLNQRLISLDVLRGIALLGILLMNIQSFAMPGAAYINPTAYGDLTGINLWVWSLSHIFADQKFMALFSMLFGVGVLVFTDNAKQKSTSVATLHYRRMGWLLLFGLIHGYLIWYGDILFCYALCGMLLYWVRNCRVRTLLLLAFVAAIIGSALNLLTGFAIAQLPPEALVEMNKSWLPSAAQLQQELDAYRGSYLEALAFRAEETLFMQTYVMLTMFIWRALAMMLLGMALYRLGFFSLRLSVRRYVVIATTTLLMGLALVLFGLSQHFQQDFALQYSMFTGTQFNYWGCFLMATGYAALIMAWVKAGGLCWFQSRLAAVGKTAFSNYILQSLLCTGLFYGLGLFGHLSRYEQLLVVQAIWLLQLVLAPIWLKHFQYGPLEWLWRGLTYWRKPVWTKAQTERAA
ncbi:DUF418 domain-containing protein [Aliiglaciecola sp. CAU 1673]|uniref:DUF418 domain-containing protein n=1 Tax=Aliiglaciecola sp. CAU 1673 TaxID=3032595 RepID=UPI0023D9828D|nr:DUF418 domain-containing protein [Aliiglaciecola sp. CAU 1673]MDF2179478.1 DUF418 domain-containing protein [Aliiglaciecola sp. CAU 1673]